MSSKAETKKLERTIYPNVLTRLVVKTSDFVKEQVNAFKQRQQNMSKDLLSVSIVSSVPVTIKTQHQATRALKKRGG